MRGRSLILGNKCYRVRVLSVWKSEKDLGCSLLSIPECRILSMSVIIICHFFCTRTFNGV
jgi:hypothetical protein